MIARFLTKHKDPILFVLSILGIAVFFVLIWGWITFKMMPRFILWIPKSHRKEAGQVGDSFGAANALFSALALAGVIVTLFMQRMELKRQREDSESNQKELVKSTKMQQLVAELEVRSKMMEYHQFRMKEIREY